MKFSFFRLISGLILWVVICGVNAAEEGEAVIVTATRTAQTADESIASVDVITRTDIEQSQATNISELLRLQAGIDVAASGGPGQQTGVFMRGTNANQTLVLIDGVRAASPTTGAFAWQHLALTNVERIEIVRGPRGSLYGSDAIGGVIQIFTRNNKSPHVRAQVGSYNSKLAEAGIGGGDKVKYSLNVTAEETDAFSATNEKLSYFNPDNDGYKNTSASGRLIFPINTKTELRFSGWYAKSETEYDDFLVDNINSTFDARLVNQTTSRWSQTLSVGLTQDDTEDQSTFGNGKIETQRIMVDWQHNFTLSLNHLLTAGLSTQEDKGQNDNLDLDTTNFDESVRDNAAFVELQSQLGDHNFNISGRIDNHETYGNHSTGNVAWGYNPTNDLRLTASYGTGFRAPSLNDLYYPFFGNPALEPETSQTLEFGLRYIHKKHQQLRLSVYRNDIENLISYDFVTAQAENINDARIDGLELEYQYNQTNWSLLATLTLQNPTNETDDTELLRRAKEKASLQIHRTLTEKGSVGLEWLFVGERLDRTLTGDVTLDPYHLINLSGVVNMAKNLWMEARIDNLLDEEYEQVYGYNTPGMSVFLGVKYKLPE